MPSVSVLKPGSLIRDESGNILDARSTVSLIRSGSRRIIVDTGLQGEEGLIVDALAAKGIRPQDIEAIVNTHCHPDHCGNNHIFSSARHLRPADGEMIAPGVRALATPGHTLDSISIAVESTISGMKITIIMAGDALPTLNNFLKGVPPALHVDRNLAVASMSRIIENADIVVPGHDRPFLVGKGNYIQLDD